MCRKVVRDGQLVLGGIRGLVAQGSKPAALVEEAAARVLARAVRKDGVASNEGGGGRGVAPEAVGDEPDAADVLSAAVDDVRVLEERVRIGHCTAEPQVHSAGMPRSGGCLLVGSGLAAHDKRRCLHIMHGPERV